MVDPITLEVLRCKLEAIAEDGSRTIMRTAISPMVAEAGDCSSTFYSADGDVIVGGGAIQTHFHVGRNGIEAIKRLHGNSVAPGDIFIVNDPYNGGGLHAQDVFIHVPVFHQEHLTGWVGTSAHMMDMGGIVPGSFSTSATEVYQEAFRVPPVRVYRAGVEQQDVWAIFRTNLRMSNIVEMDLRSLISGANVVRDQVLKLIENYGQALFSEAVQVLADLTEAEARRSISELEPGTYKAASWSEWEDELFHIPCVLLVTADKLVFDFTGASPQTNHYVNTKPHILKSLIGVALKPYLALDAPLNEGVFRAFELICEPGSILDAQPPAPVAGAHLDVGQTALEVATRALNLAIATSPNARMGKNMAGPSSASGLTLHTLAGKGSAGEPVAWVMADAVLTAASGGHDRDATQMTYQVVGSGILEMVDIEVLESWYPILYRKREPRPGWGGAGTYCAGRSASISYSVHGSAELSAMIKGNRASFPIAGVDGGLPGFVTSLQLQKSGAAAPQPLSTCQENLRLSEGDTVIIDVANGGGWGDPFDRNPDVVLQAVQRGLLTAKDARTYFGVVPGNPEATSRARRELRQQHLAQAQAAPAPLEWTPELRRLAEGVSGRLGFSVEQRGAVAVARGSSAPLSVSPRPWTDGCPRLHNFIPSADTVDVIAYLDPETGAVLAVDVVPAGGGCSFEISPYRWMAAANLTHERAGAVS